MVLDYARTIVSNDVSSAKLACAHENMYERSKNCEPPFISPDLLPCWQRLEKKQSTEVLNNFFPPKYTVPYHAHAPPTHLHSGPLVFCAAQPQALCLLLRDHVDRSCGQENMYEISENCETLFISPNFFHLN